MLCPPLLALVICFISVSAQFQVPEVQFQAITPIGFRASIQAILGIEFFEFNGKFETREGENTKNLSIKGRVSETKDGRFTFEDNKVKLNDGDTILYWVFINHEGMGYRLSGQRFNVLELVPSNTPFPPFTQTTNDTDVKHCEASKTTVNTVNSCERHLIFEENFDTQKINTNIWTIEQRLPQEYQENEFVSYQKSGVKIEKNTLKITPTLLRNSPDGKNKEKILDLSLECTANLQEYCKIEAENQFIVPPVISGKITTRDKFSFKYGRIEIRAKFPQGDWIYPELYLEPVKYKYGIKGYDSGLIRVAFARGNLELKSNTEDYGNKVLSGGVLFDQFELCRRNGIKVSPDKTVPWGDDYHVYGLTWKEDSIVLHVDGKEYGVIKPPKGGFKSYSSHPTCEILEKVHNRWRSGSILAPFDEEFHITIGIGVGGISDFPNSVSKPWNNSDPKAQYNFNNDLDHWHSTWQDDHKSLHVDSIKIWAL